jgi:hypothetical protein
MVWKSYISSLEHLWTTDRDVCQLQERVDDEGRPDGYRIIDNHGRPLTIEIEDLRQYVVNKMLEVGVKIVSHKEWEEHLPKKWLRSNQSEDS